jgi:hypothetical protein
VDIVSGAPDEQWQNALRTYWCNIYGLVALLKTAPQHMTVPENEMTLATGRAVNRRKQRPLATPVIDSPSFTAPRIKIHGKRFPASIRTFHNKLALDATADDQGAVAWLSQERSRFAVPFHLTAQGA